MNKHRFALVRLGKNGDVLFSEYKRAKRCGMKKRALEKEIAMVLSKNEWRSPLMKAIKIVDRLLSLGTEEGEMNAETKKHR